MENLQNLQREEPTLIASEPYCVVIAGDCAELNSPEKKAFFERFRERLNDVRILTFDEVYQRIEGLLKILQIPSGLIPQDRTLLSDPPVAEGEAGFQMRTTGRVTHREIRMLLARFTE